MQVLRAKLSFLAADNYAQQLRDLKFWPKKRRLQKIRRNATINQWEDEIINQTNHGENITSALLRLASTQLK